MVLSFGDYLQTVGFQVITLDIRMTGVLGAKSTVIFQYAPPRSHIRFPFGFFFFCQLGYNTNKNTGGKRAAKMHLEVSRNLLADDTNG